MTGEITQIKLDGENYPKLLSQIPDPPKQLYCRGNFNLLNSECIGIVGTRKLTSYGRESAQYITRGMATAGFTIVSGLAMGIDAVAHQAALDIGGKTIAVLGGGVDNKSISPQINFNLAMNVLKNNGLIVSEYPEGFHPNEKTFPQRNRIISGLSRGVVIVEADKESGALITAYCALDQNRDVFAVPGNIFSNKSIGSNELIKRGAKLITSARDITDEYGYNLNIFDPVRGKMPAEGGSSADRVPQEWGCPHSENHALQAGRTSNGAGSTLLKDAILAILQDEGESSADGIIDHLPSIDTSDILSSLSVLEINGLIKKSGNGKYRIA